ncbi:MAG: Rieske 2Fe-2S domain-containing protein [Bacteroidetes bacterium]|nr:Rieske 2Fe-2S domain-containing protein [Bacteroidota bacterium]
MPVTATSPSQLTWTKVLGPDELPEGRVLPVTCALTTVCMTHFEGEYGALDNHCPYQGGPLGEGSIEKGLLRCPWHGWDYHPLTGTPAISPSRFPDLASVEDFRRVADEVREESGGIPIGFKLSAQHIEADIDFALDVTVDYIILDGRGGATGAAPEIFKNNISVPTLAALARARRHLNKRGADGVTLIITGGLRTESDFVKALALGADGVAVANSALQAIGCLGMRACHTNNCPVGIATQKPSLRARLEIAASARQLANFFEATVHLMQILARACGHDQLSGFNTNDLTTWKRDIAHLTGVRYAGVEPD